MKAAGEVSQLVQQALDAFGDDISVIDTRDGGLYIGNAQADEPDGVGTRLWPEHDEAGRQQYVGRFAQGRRDGGGMMTFADGTHYEGEWQGGKPNGYGVETYPDGATYTGQFKDDKRDGMGKYVCADGSSEHAGFWRNGAWGKSVEPSTQAQLDAVIKFSMHARDDAVRLGGELLIFNKLASCLPPAHRGSLSKLIAEEQRVALEAERARLDAEVEQARLMEAQQTRLREEADAAEEQRVALEAERARLDAEAEQARLVEQARDTEAEEDRLPENAQQTTLAAVASAHAFAEANQKDVESSHTLAEQAAPAVSMQEDAGDARISPRALDLAISPDASLSEYVQAHCATVNNETSFDSLATDSSMAQEEIEIRQALQKSKIDIERIALEVEETRLAEEATLQQGNPESSSLEQARGSELLHPQPGAGSPTGISLLVQEGSQLIEQLEPSLAEVLVTTLLEVRPRSPLTTFLIDNQKAGDKESHDIKYAASSESSHSHPHVDKLQTDGVQPMESLDSIAGGGTGQLVHESEELNQICTDHSSPPIDVEGIGSLPFEVKLLPDSQTQQDPAEKSLIELPQGSISGDLRSDDEIPEDPKPDQNIGQLSSIAELSFAESSPSGKSQIEQNDPNGFQTDMDTGIEGAIAAAIWNDGDERPSDSTGANNEDSNPTSSIAASMTMPTEKTGNLLKHFEDSVEAVSTSIDAAEASGGRKGATEMAEVLFEASQAKAEPANDGPSAEPTFAKNVEDVDIIEAVEPAVESSAQHKKIFNKTVEQEQFNDDARAAPTGRARAEERLKMQETELQDVSAVVLDSIIQQLERIEREQRKEREEETGRQQQRKDLKMAKTHLSLAEEKTSQGDISGAREQLSIAVAFYEKTKEFDKHLVEAFKAMKLSIDRVITCVILQRFVRRCLARKRDRRALLYKKQNKRHTAAAIRIQTVLRIKFAKLEHHFMARMVPSKHKAANSIQALLRGHAARKMSRTQLLGRSNEAKVLIVQKAFRCHLARKHFSGFAHDKFRQVASSFACRIQTKVRQCLARRHLKNLRKAMGMMQQWSARFAWKRTMDALTGVAAAEWRTICLHTSKLYGRKEAFSRAQILAPAILPSWWLSHFPLELSKRVDLKQHPLIALQNQIRDDRIQILGANGDFTKSLNILSSLVVQLTGGAKRIALDLTSSYDMLVSLIVFCNIKGLDMVSQIDFTAARQDPSVEKLQSMGFEMLKYAERLCDGPNFVLRGLTEKLEYKQWTVNNLCHVYWANGDYDKAIEYARKTSETKTDDLSRNELISIISSINLALVQSKIGKHNTAIGILHKASDQLVRLCSRTSPLQREWSSFCSSRILTRRYQCSATHLAGVCQYNLAIEYAAIDKMGEAVHTIKRAIALAVRNQNSEPIFLRRCKRTLISLETVVQDASGGKGPLPACVKRAMERQKDSSANNLRSDSRPRSNSSTASSSILAKVQTIKDARDLVNDNETSTRTQTELSIMKFGLWFPPHVSLRLMPQVDVKERTTSENGLPQSSEPESARAEELSSIFVRLPAPRGGKFTVTDYMGSSVHGKEWSARYGISSLSSGLSCSTSGYFDEEATFTKNEGSRNSLMLLTLPMTETECLEILHPENIALQKYVMTSNTRDGLKAIQRAKSSIALAPSKMEKIASVSMRQRMMGVIVIAIQMASKLLGQQSSGPLDLETGQLAQKYVALAESLLFNGTFDFPQFVELKAYTRMLHAVCYCAQHQDQKALWVLTESLRELSIRNHPKIHLVMLLNLATVLANIGKHQEAFEASEVAWSVLQDQNPKDEWFCYAASHNDCEMTRLSPNIFASFCCYQQSRLSFALGFLVPAQDFCEKSVKMLSHDSIPSTRLSDDVVLTEAISNLAVTLQSQLEGGQPWVSGDAGCESRDESGGDRRKHKKPKLPTVAGGNRVRR